MTHDDLITKGAELLTKLENTNDEGRKALLPELEKHLSELRIAGLDAPVRLKELEQEVHDDAVEDIFDNMPL